MHKVYIAQQLLVLFDPTNFVSLYKFRKKGEIPIAKWKISEKSYTGR